MKINGGSGSNKVDHYIKNKITQKKEGAVSETSSEPAARDSVEISQAKTEITRAREVIREQPEVRTEKVETIKQEVDEGTYKVDGEKVAEKIIKENILDELL